MVTVLWSQEYDYGPTTVLVERLAKGWRLERPDGRAVERRSLVEAFDALLGGRAGGAELKVVLAALTADPSAHGVTIADSPMMRELRGLDENQDQPSG